MRVCRVVGPAVAAHRRRAETRLVAKAGGGVSATPRGGRNGPSIRARDGRTGARGAGGSGDGGGEYAWPSPVMSLLNRLPNLRGR